MLTQEEKAALRARKLSALKKCRILYPMITNLKEALAEYQREYSTHRRAYEDADYALAEDEKLIVVPLGVSGKSREKLIGKLTQEQILQIASELGVEL